MAERKPLILNAQNRPEEMASGDRLPVSLGALPTGGTEGQFLGYGPEWVDAPGGSTVYGLLRRKRSDSVQTVDTDEVLTGTSYVLSSGLSASNTYGTNSGIAVGAAGLYRCAFSASGYRYGNNNASIDFFIRKNTTLTTGYETANWSIWTSVARTDHGFVSGIEYWDCAANDVINVFSYPGSADWYLQNFRLWVTKV